MLIDLLQGSRVSCGAFHVSEHALKKGSHLDKRDEARIADGGATSDAARSRDVQELVAREIQRRLEIVDETVREPFFRRCERSGVFSKEDNIVRAQAAMRVAAFREVGHREVSREVKHNEALFRKVLADNEASGGVLTSKVHQQARAKVTVAGAVTAKLELLNGRRQRRNSATETSAARLSRRLDVEVGSDLSAASRWFAAQEAKVAAQSEAILADNNERSATHSHTAGRKAVWDASMFEAAPQLQLPVQDINLTAWKDEALRVGDRRLLKSTDADCVNATCARSKPATLGFDLDGQENEPGAPSSEKNRDETGTTRRQQIHRWSHEYFMRPIGALDSGVLFHPDWFVPSLPPLGVDMNQWTQRGPYAPVMARPFSVLNGPDKTGAWPMGVDGVFEESESHSTAKELEALFAGDLAPWLAQAREMDVEICRFLYQSPLLTTTATQRVTSYEALTETQDSFAGEDLLLYDPCVHDEEGGAPCADWIEDMAREEKQRDDDSLEELQDLSSLIIKSARESCNCNAPELSEEDWIAQHVDQSKQNLRTILSPSPLSAWKYRLAPALASLEGNGFSCASVLLSMARNDLNLVSPWLLACQYCLLAHTTTCDETVE
ncbi:Hypothetical Protein FCC1311_062992 [Hondaea fermentalgiana]|uniref:Uncharacterized protein n=1 Tax=Hondaea fermentalgiana TaxID=2315210 RepID=A0A2R5GID7_9STRA|nr:Hypothetical Protein FCC1311_062992 [Hondaea fermentalgiana]|eukprot:GBG30079.1 Hypothetical Protein FCC1311_062992 [Hondaea fermentalgiana]